MLDLAHGVVAGRLAAQRLVLLGARDDLRVEVCQLLHEAQVFVAERVGAGRMVDIEDAEHLAGVDQRDAERRLHVDPFAQQVVLVAIGPATQMDRSAFRGDPARDALAERDADLRPELGLDAPGHADPQCVRLRIEQHQAAALGAGDTDRDLEHAIEELVGLDRQLDRLHHLVQGLQQLGLAVAGATP